VGDDHPVRLREGCRHGVPVQRGDGAQVDDLGVDAVPGEAPAAARLSSAIREYDTIVTSAPVRLTAAFPIGTK